jgi:hypothetical protein
MKYILSTTILLCSSLAMASLAERQAVTANLQFEIESNTFRGNNPITMGRALDTTQKLFSISIGSIAGTEQEVLCQAFNGSRSVGVFFSSRDLKFTTTGGQDITRIECDLPTFPVKANPNPPSSPVSSPAVSQPAPSATSPPSGSPGNEIAGPTITFIFETEFATTFRAATFPFGSVLDVDERIVSARIRDIKDADGKEVDASKVRCSTLRDQSSQSAGDITSLDKTFFDRRNPVRITQISCTGLDGAN